MNNNDKNVDNIVYLSQIFTGGDYANHYVSGDLWKSWTDFRRNRKDLVKREGAFTAFTLGFFASYDEDEIPEEHQERHRTFYLSPTGQLIVSKGWIDPYSY